MLITTLPLVKEISQWYWQTYSVQAQRTLFLNARGMSMDYSTVQHLKLLGFSVKVMSVHVANAHNNDIVGCTDVMHAWTRIS